MVDELDIRVSRRLRKILQRVERLVEKEIGEPFGIGLVVFPWTREGEKSRVAEYQYTSNAPREHMHGVMKALVAKWDGKAIEIPPHERN
jgi:hypothetical protein